MNKNNQKTRRDFIKKVSGGALVAGTIPSLILPTSARAESIESFSKIISPNDNVNIALIGSGIMGFNNVNTALKVPGVKLVAACDLYDGRLERMKEVYGDELYTTKSYEKILSRSDVDAVIVATSDQWHDQISIDAMTALQYILFFNNKSMRRMFFLTIERFS